MNRTLSCFESHCETFNGFYIFIPLSQEKRHFEKNGLDYSNPDVIYKRGIQKYFQNIFPLVAAFILVIPLLIFFKTFYISAETSKFYHFYTEVYFDHLFSIIGYFAQYEFIYLALVIKLGIAFLYRRHRHIINSKSLRLKIDISIFLVL